MNVLELSSEWKTPPWEITGDGKRIVWYVRTRTWQEQRNRAIKAKAKKK